MNSNFISRIRSIVACVFFVALVIIAKLFFVQVFQGKTYSEKADKQYVKPETSNFDRGSIFFTSKNGIKIAAATIKDGYNLSINPKLIKDPQQVFDALSQYIELDKTVFLDKARDPTSVYKELQKRMELPLGKSIAQLRITGVMFKKKVGEYILEVL